MGFYRTRLKRMFVVIPLTLAILQYPIGCSANPPPPPEYHIEVDIPDVEQPYDVVPDDADGVSISYTAAIRSGWVPDPDAPPGNPYVGHMANSQFQGSVEGDDQADLVTVRLSSSAVQNSGQITQPPGQYSLDLYAQVIWTGSQQWVHPCPDNSDQHPG
jgi:hypothetical protein